MLGEAVARGRHAETSPGDQPEADPAAEKKKKKRENCSCVFFWMEISFESFLSLLGRGAAPDDVVPAPFVACQGIQSALSTCVGTWSLPSLSTGYNGS